MDIDVDSLYEKAASSPDGEAFQTVLHEDGCRVGVGARGRGALFIEVLITPFPGDRVELDRLERCLHLLRWLERRSYTLSCQDGRAVCGELVVEQEKIGKELEAAVARARAALGV